MFDISTSVTVLEYMCFSTNYVMYVYIRLRSLDHVLDGGYTVSHIDV